MDVALDPIASRLLALMHEADAEAVTLDELAIAGELADPAQALHALELAGFTFERMTDRTAARDEIECIRLARATAEQATAEWSAPAEPTPTPSIAPPIGTSGGLDGTLPFDAPHAPAAAPDRAASRSAQLVDAADRRPLLLALVALVLVALLGRAVVGRR